MKEKMVRMKSIKKSMQVSPKWSLPLKIASPRSKKYIFQYPGIYKKDWAGDENDQEFDHHDELERNEQTS